MFFKNPRRYDLRQLDRHTDSRRRRRQLRTWLRSFAFLRLPDWRFDALGDQT